MLLTSYKESEDSEDIYKEVAEMHGQHSYLGFLTSTNLDFSIQSERQETLKGPLV